MTLFIDFRTDNTPFISFEKVLIGNINSFDLFQAERIDVLKLISEHHMILRSESIILIINDQTKGKLIAQKLTEKWPQKTFTPLSDVSVLKLFEDISSPPLSPPSSLMRSFSMIIPNLYISDMYHAQNFELLSTLNINAIINIAPKLAENKFEQKYPFVYMTIYEDDNPKVDIKSYFSLTNKFIDKYRKDRGVLVHCAAGISRSTTVIIAYVMYKLKLGFNEAYTFVQERHPITDPNFGFICQLHQYEKEIKGTE
jgi:protein-tyrosine phosphatase